MARLLFHRMAIRCFCGLLGCSCRLLGFNGLVARLCCNRCSMMRNHIVFILVHLERQKRLLCQGWRLRLALMLRSLDMLHWLIDTIEESWRFLAWSIRARGQSSIVVVNILLVDDGQLVNISWRLLLFGNHWATTIVIPHLLLAQYLLLVYSFLARTSTALATASATLIDRWCIHVLLHGWLFLGRLGRSVLLQLWMMDATLFLRIQITIHNLMLAVLFSI